MISIVRSALTSAALLTLVAACFQTPEISVSTFPEIKTKPPIIYLADNLDEEDKLGWCIDTLGRGFSEQLHAHSCKPVGDDVRFKYQAETGQIKSFAYDGKCAAIVAPDNAAIPLGLVDCDAETEVQKFEFVPASSEFHPRSDPSLCMTVSAKSRAAGPYMSRDLKLEKCSSVKPRYKQWTIADDGENGRIR